MTEIVRQNHLKENTITYLVFCYTCIFLIGQDKRVIIANLTCTWCTSVGCVILVAIFSLEAAAVKHMLLPDHSSFTGGVSEVQVGWKSSRYILLQIYKQVCALANFNILFISMEFGPGKLG